MTIKEFQTLFGDFKDVQGSGSGSASGSASASGSGSAPYVRKAVIGIEKRGLASASDLKILLQAMGEDISKWDEITKVVYEYVLVGADGEDFRSSMETVERKLLLSYSDMEGIIKGLGLKLDLAPFGNGDKHTSITITDLRQMLITLCSDYTAPDTEAPVITMEGSNPTTITKCDTYKDAGAKAQDAVDGDLTAEIQTQVNVIDGKIGVYNVEYSVKDKAGNEARATRVVNVVDAVCPPVGSGSGSTSGSASASHS